MTQIFNPSDASFYTDYFVPPTTAAEKREDMTQVFNPGDAYVGQNFLGVSSATLGQIALAGLTSVVKGIAKRTPKSSFGKTFPEGADIRIDETVGPRRRRRRRLLTCGDKADLAFLVGQLGTGATGKAAVSSLLSRRCG